MTRSVVGLIPARSGSKRVLGKNIRPLASHPLIAYSIAAAHGSALFDDVIVSTDSEKYADIARHYGASVPFLRPVDSAGDLSPDIEWVAYTLSRLRDEGRTFDCFSILRPTSPFRLPGTIQRAWMQFSRAEGIDSIRAVELCSQHPGKMWVVRGERLVPLLPIASGEQPWHSSQYQALPQVYIQNGSLEIAHTRVVFDGRTIAGEVLMPFLTAGFEGFDLNHPYDWQLAEELVRTGQAALPQVTQLPYVT